VKQSISACFSFKMCLFPMELSIPWPRCHGCRALYFASLKSVCSTKINHNGLLDIALLCWIWLIRKGERFWSICFTCNIIEVPAASTLILTKNSQFDIYMGEGWIQRYKNRWDEDINSQQLNQWKYGKIGPQKQRQTNLHKLIYVISVPEFPEWDGTIVIKATHWQQEQYKHKETRKAIIIYTICPWFVKVEIHCTRAISSATCDFYWYVSHASHIERPSAAAFKSNSHHHSKVDADLVSALKCFSSLP